MLRIHFTAADLGRTRVRSGPDALWEIVNSVQLLQNRMGGPVFDGWRREFRSRVAGTDAEAAVRTVATLCPHAPYVPDFLTPSVEDGDAAAGVEAVLSTPRRQLAHEVARLAENRRLPGWARGVASGDPETLRRFGDALRAYHDVAVRPHLPHIEAELRRECSERALIALHGGAEAVLSSFGPFMRWEAPVLHVDYPAERELHLGGRGLLLVPSFFCWRRPISLVDPELRPTLVYPIQHDPRWLRPEPARGQRRGSGLVALIGATRTAVLESVVQGRTTTQLAALVGISAATASHHTGVLRDAGLITTRREGNTAVHTITPLGAVLLAEES
jgi:DNA-binding transcriptional ArsR family regulator